MGIFQEVNGGGGGGKDLGMCKNGREDPSYDFHLANRTEFLVQMTMVRCPAWFCTKKLNGLGQNTGHQA